MLHACDKSSKFQTKNILFQMVISENRVHQEWTASIYLDCLQNGVNGENWWRVLVELSLKHDSDNMFFCFQDLLPDLVSDVGVQVIVL